MQDKLWKVIGFWAMGLILFIATMIIIRWAIEFVTWSTLDSGWAQAIGSIAALGVAIYVMSRQNAHAARLMIDADTRTALRFASAVAALVARAYIQILDAVSNIEHSGKASSDPALRKITEMTKGALSETKKALTAIPVHELGAFELVEGLIQMIESINSLESTLDELSTGKLPREVIPGRAKDIRLSAETAWKSFEAGKSMLSAAG